VDLDGVVGLCGFFVGCVEKKSKTFGLVCFGFEFCVYDLFSSSGLWVLISASLLCRLGRELVAFLF
jgi:hypothetical protein